MLQEALNEGLAMGELVAARSNFFTVLKMVVPLAYARLYAHGQRLPFMFAGGLIVLAQVRFNAHLPSICFDFDALIWVSFGADHVDDDQRQRRAAEGRELKRPLKDVN